MSTRDFIELRLKPQDPTFTDNVIGETQPGSGKTNNHHDTGNRGPDYNPTFDEKEQRKIPRTVFDVDAIKVLEMLLREKQMDNLSGTESMSILSLFLEELIWVSEKIENQEITTLEFNNAIFGNNLWKDILSSLDEKNDFEILSSIRSFKTRFNNKEMMKLISKSEEELGISIRKSSKIFSNFESEKSDDLEPDDLKRFVGWEMGRYERCCNDKKMTEWISNKFYLKSAPKMEIKAYINRINSNLSISGAVGLCAGWFLFKYVFNLKCIEKLSDGITLEKQGELKDAKWENRRFPLVFGNSFRNDSEKTCNLENDDTNDKQTLDSFQAEEMSLNFSTASTINGTNEDQNENSPGSFEDKDLVVSLLPVNKRNAFRLILTTVRVASKLLEDKNYRQNYYCKVSGLQKISDLFRLELALGYGLDWDLFANGDILWRYVQHVYLFIKGCQQLRANM